MIIVGPAFPVVAGAAQRLRGSDVDEVAAVQRHRPRPADQPGQQMEADVSRVRPGDLVDHRGVRTRTSRHWPGRRADAPASPRTRRPGRRPPRRCRPASDRAPGTATGWQSPRRPGARRSARPRSKSVRLSALIARNMSSPATKSRLARRVPALPSSSGSTTRRTAGGPTRAATCASHLVGQVVRVQQHLADAGLGQRVQPDVEHRPATDCQQALRRAVGDRPQPGPEARGEQERLHRAGLADHAQRAHLRVRLGQDLRPARASPPATPRTRRPSPRACAAATSRAASARRCRSGYAGCRRTGTRR